MRLDYGLRTSLAKDIEGQMSIVTQLPDLEPSSMVDQKVHGMVTYIHKRGGGDGGKSVGRIKMWLKIQVRRRSEPVFVHIAPYGRHW